MKRLIFLLMMIITISVAAYGDETESTSTGEVPVITKAYEVSSGTLLIEWTGDAPLFRVLMDGKKVADVAVNEAKFDVSNGTHSIVVYPIVKKDKGDTSVHVGAELPKVGGFDVGFDLASIGLNAKDLVAGEPSDALRIDFMKDSLIDTEIETPTAITDEKDRVCLSFTDNYYADLYRVMIKSGKAENYVDYSVGDNTDLVSRDNATVTIILDPDYLQENSCSSPELDQDYTFSVQLRKYAINLCNNESLETAIHESKASKGLKYTPTAAWKAAPSITYASQTADGQVTLRWEHEDYGKGCQYEILRIKKTLGVAKKEEIVGTTDTKEYIISDLENGEYSYKVVPLVEDERGSESDEVKIDVKNEWVVAPELEYEQTDEGEVKLTWPVTDGVEKYHITVLRGDSKSPLRYLNLDYKEYTEVDIEDFTDNAEYLFSYEDGTTIEPGTRLRFEIYGIRYTADGEEQKTTTTKINVVTK